MRWPRKPAGLPRRALFISGGLLGLSVVYFMIVPLLSLYLSARLHSSPVRIGVVLAVMTVANQGLQIFVGVLSDRFSIKTVLTGGIFAACLGYAGFADHPSFVLQLGSGVALGIGTAATSVLGKAMLASASAARTSSAFALRAAAVNAGAAVGPVAGGLLFGWFPAMLLATVVVYAGYWLFLVRPMPSSRPTSGRQAGVRQQVVALLRVRPLLALSAVSIGFWYLYTQLNLTFALYANDRFRLGGKVGLLFGAEALVSVLLQLPAITWLQRRTDNWRILAIGSATLTAAFLFLGVLPGVWVLLLFVVVFAAGSLLVIPTLDVVAAELSPTAAVAGALGVASLGWAVGGLLGNVVGGALYGAARHSGHFGYFWAFNALLALITAAAFVVARRRWAEKANGKRQPTTDSPEAGMKPILLVLSSGDAEYREYVLRHLAARYRLLLLTPYPPTWESPYIIEHVQIDPADAEGVIVTAVKAAGRMPVAGVITYHEPCVALVATIAAKLGLPHCPPEAAALCRDKFAAREALDRAHVPSARYRLAADVDEARRAADEIGYPVVVKPRALSAGFGVSLAGQPADLAGAFSCAETKSLPEPWAHRRGVLLEEFLDGPEISVDSAVRGGRVQPVIFAKKLLGFAPFFEEEGHIVGPPGVIVPDPDAVTSVVEAAHQALGIDNGVTHTEIRLTATGPRVVEVNGRSGGDMIPYLAYLAAGLDLPLASGDIAVGAEPELTAAWVGVAGIRFLYPPSPGRLVSAEVVGPNGGRPSWLHHVTWLAAPGTEFRDLPGSLYFARAGFAIVTADSVEECGARLAAVKDQARMVVEPV